MKTNDYRLHELAGLVPTGMDTDGEQVWLGSDKQWSRYLTLEKEWSTFGSSPLPPEEELKLEAMREGEEEVKGRQVDDLRDQQQAIKENL